MAFLLAQSSTDYIALLDDIAAEAVKQEVGVAVVNSGGTGYSVSDVLTVSGGTGTAATLTVTAETGGVIDTVDITTPGRYTVFPTSPASVTGGGGSSATFDLTAVGWELQMETQEAVSATVAAGGVDYNVSDQLTLVGGTLSELTGSAAAVFNVDSVGGSGEVTGVSLVSKGKYDFVPGDPVSTTVSPDVGTGCTLNVTWQGFEDGEKQVILKGNGSVGTDEIYVGLSARDFGSSVYQWDIRGFTGFQSNVNFSSQPGISPAGSYVPLNNSSIRWWLFISPRRIITVFRMGGTYTNMYLGLIKPFATTAQYPYPLAVIGCSSTPQIFSSSTIAMSGMTDPINVSTGNRSGPGYLRTPGGSWRGMANSSGTSSRQQNTELVIWPCGSVVNDSDFDTTDFVPPTGNPGTPSSSLRQTEDSGVTSGWVFPLFSTMIIETDPDEALHGELDNVYWSGTITEDIGQAISEDQYDVAGQIYHLFQNANRTDPWAYFLVKEE